MCKAGGWYPLSEDFLLHTPHGIQLSGAFCHQSMNLPLNYNWVLTVTSLLFTVFDISSINLHNGTNGKSYYIFPYWQKFHIFPH
jgi:hypothetical protein